MKILGSEITPLPAYLNRRNFIKSSVISIGSLFTIFETNNAEIIE